MREQLSKVTALRSMNNLYVLGKGQYFMQTPKAYEIWGVYDGLPRRVHRIPKKSIYWVFEDPAFAYGGESNPESDWRRP